WMTEIVASIRKRTPNRKVSESFLIAWPNSKLACEVVTFLPLTHVIDWANKAGAELAIVRILWILEERKGEFAGVACVLLLARMKEIIGLTARLLENCAGNARPEGIIFTHKELRLHIIPIR